MVHPKGLVYNAAGNAAIIEAVNAAGMGAGGSAADHISIATYLDSVKPTITLVPVAHDSSGTVISLRDITVSRATDNAALKIIAGIANFSAPTKGTVTYRVGNGFAKPTTVTYKPFPGQSGIDTWTYQGSGEGPTAGLSTTVRTASVVIAASATPSPLDYSDMWWVGDAENGWGMSIQQHAEKPFVAVYVYDNTGKPTWYVLPSGTWNADFTVFTGAL